LVITSQWSVRKLQQWLLWYFAFLRHCLPSGSTKVHTPY
jgi:hypothetical protein